MRMLDLFSGLGGASEAFVQAGWDVLRLDNDPLVADIPYTEMQNLSRFNDDPSSIIGIQMCQKEYPLDLVWASPPCLDFTRGFAAPAPTAQREGRDFEPDLNPLRTAKHLIDTINPDWWVIENVSGASKIFSQELGMPPRQIIGPYFLWGVFPRIAMDYSWERPKGKCQDWNMDDPLRSTKRAKIPLEISQKLLEAITQQRTLKDFP